MPSYDDDEYDDRRGRRRSREDDDYDERDDYDDDWARRRDPKDRLIGPGRSLMIVGFIGAALSVIIPAIIISVVLNERPANQADVEETMILSGIFGLISAVYFGLIGFGGLKMMKAQSYGLAMTAAVLTIISIACVGVFSVVMLPFGIWAMVVLCDSKVKKVFHQYRPAIEDDYDDDYR